MYRRIKYLLEKSLMFFVFLLSFLISFEFFDYYTFKKLHFRYGYSLSLNEIVMANKIRDMEYEKGNYELFNWISYKVEEVNDGYYVFFYPPNAGEHGFKFFLFSITDGLCCGQKKFFLSKK